MTGHRWWVLVDSKDLIGALVHLLERGDETRAACGQVLPPGVMSYDQLPAGDPCELCRLSYVADCAEDCVQRARQGTN